METDLVDTPTALISFKCNIIVFNIDQVINIRQILCSVQAKSTGKGDQSNNPLDKYSPRADMTNTF